MASCMYCGQPTVIRQGEITNELTGEHGLGKCCNPCEYCRDGVPHVISACAAPNGWTDTDGYTHRTLRVPVIGERNREAYLDHISSHLASVER